MEPWSGHSNLEQIIAIFAKMLTKPTEPLRRKHLVGIWYAGNRLVVASALKGISKWLGNVQRCPQ